MFKKRFVRLATRYAFFVSSILFLTTGRCYRNCQKSEVGGRKPSDIDENRPVFRARCPHKRRPRDHPEVAHPATRRSRPAGQRCDNVWIRFPVSSGSGEYRDRVLYWQFVCTNYVERNDLDTVLILNAICVTTH